MFELSQDLPIVMSVGTLIGLIGTVVHYTSKIAAFKKEIELKCSNVTGRVEKLESLELGVILARIQADVEWLKNERMNANKKN